MKIIRCKKCGLHKYRRKIVTGRGVIPADVLFLGEAPGRSENIIGEAFIGRSGKLLDSIMTEAANILLHIPIPSFFIINTILCRPTNSINGDNRKPTEAEILACRPLVKKIIAEVNPKEVVFIGKVSERYYSSEYPGSIRILHPSYLLRDGGESSSFYWIVVRQLTELFERVNDAKKETFCSIGKTQGKPRRRFTYPT